jgi:hypothetical protein
MHHTQSLFSGVPNQERLGCADGGFAHEDVRVCRARPGRAKEVLKKTCLRGIRPDEGGCGPPRRQSRPPSV